MVGMGHHQLMYNIAHGAELRPWLRRLIRFVKRDMIINFSKIASEHHVVVTNYIKSPGVWVVSIRTAEPDVTWAAGDGASPREAFKNAHRRLKKQ